MKSNLKKVLALILALSLLITASISALSSNAALEQKPPEVLLDTLVDAIEAAYKENPDLDFESWLFYGGFDYEKYIEEHEEELVEAFQKEHDGNIEDYDEEELQAWLMEYLSPKMGGLLGYAMKTKNMSLVDRFNAADDLTKAEIILFNFYMPGGPSGEYSNLFRNNISNMFPGYIRLLEVTGQDSDLYCPEEFDSWEEYYTLLLSGYEFFTRTPDFKEYLEILIAYLGYGEKIATDIVTQQSPGSGYRIPKSDNTSYDDGTSFYEVYDDTYGSESDSELLKWVKATTTKENVGAYGLLLSIYGSMLGVMEPLTAKEYANFLQAVYDYMYPTETVTPTTTTTRPRPQDITNIKWMTNVTRITNITRPAGITGLTNLTNATGVTNVTASNVALPR